MIVPRVHIPLQTLTSRSRPRSTICVILLTATLVTSRSIFISSSYSSSKFTSITHVCTITGDQSRYTSLLWAFNPVSLSKTDMTTISSTEFQSPRPHPPPKIKFLLDFDSTLTTSDTLSILSQLSRSSKSWDYFTGSYLNDLQRFVPPPPSPSPSTRGHTTIKQELEHLEEYFLTEKRSVERLEEEKYFAGLRSGKVRNHGKGEIWVFGRDVVREGKVMIRDGWWEVEKFLTGGRRRGEIGIVSVNWSKEFIAGVMEGSYSLWRGQRMRGEETEGEEVEEEEGKSKIQKQQRQSIFSIYSNDFLVSPDTGLTTGKFSRRPLPSIDRGIWTARDKLEVMEEIRQNSNGDGGEDGENAFTVYVGDSPTDLGCLLRADVGIVMGGNKELKEIFGRLKLRVDDGMEGVYGTRKYGESERESKQPQKDGKEHEGKGREKKLFRVKDFWEVLKWLETLYE